MRLIAGTRHLAAVVPWKPLVATTTATLAWQVITGRPSTLMLSLAVAGVGAATAPLIDDPAAATLQPSPTTLLRRRSHRIVLGLPLIAVWWALVMTIAQRSGPPFALAVFTLQLAAFIAVGLACSSVVHAFARRDGRGGIAGAVVVMVCLGSGLSPRRWLQIVPMEPDGPGAAPQLALVVLVAVSAYLRASADPARRRGFFRSSRRSVVARLGA